MRSPATFASPGAARRAAAHASRVGRQLELAGEPDEPQRAQRVGLDRAPAPASRSRPAARSAAPPSGSTSCAALERPRDRVDREVAQARGPPRSSPPRSGLRSACQPCGARDDAPGAELVREREAAVAARRARERAGRRVDVGRRSPGRGRCSAGRPSSSSRTAPPTSQARVPPQRLARESRALPSRHRSSAVAMVAARHARADRARDLVVDRPLPRGDLLGRDPLARRRCRAGPLPRPARTPLAQPRSAVMLSMLTVPTSGRRRPPISTSALFGEDAAARRRRSRPGSLPARSPRAR